MKIYSVIVLPLLLLAVKCTDESEENRFYKNEQLDEYRFEQNPVTKEVAVQKWEVFLKESQDLIFYTRNNLQALQYQIDETDGAQKFELVKEQQRISKAIDNLERKRQQRDNVFKTELEHFDPQAVIRNEAFQKTFKRDIIRLNIALGCSVDDQP